MADKYGYQQNNPVDAPQSGGTMKRFHDNGDGTYSEVIYIGGGGGGAATIADGADVNAGATGDAAVTTNAAGTLSAKLRGVVAILAAVWDSTNNLIKSSVQAFKGAANVAVGQVATSTTSGVLLAARATRRSVTFVNADGAITVYIGTGTVTAGNGLPLKAGQSVSVDTVAALNVIAASGTPSVAYVETYD